MELHGPFWGHMHVWGQMPRKKKGFGHGAACVSKPIGPRPNVGCMVASCHTDLAIGKCTCLFMGNQQAGIKRFEKDEKCQSFALSFSLETLNSPLPLVTMIPHTGWQKQNVAVTRKRQSQSRARNLARVYKVDH